MFLLDIFKKFLIKKFLYHLNFLCAKTNPTPKSKGANRRQSLVGASPAREIAGPWQGCPATAGPPTRPVAVGVAPVVGAPRGRPCTRRGSRRYRPRPARPARAAPMASRARVAGRRRARAHPHRQARRQGAGGTLRGAGTDPCAAAGLIPRAWSQPHGAGCSPARAPAPPVRNAPTAHR